jgi:hypothetical protein
MRCAVAGYDGNGHGSNYAESHNNVMRNIAEAPLRVRGALALPQRLLDIGDG